MVEMKDQHSGAWNPMRRGDSDNHWNANVPPPASSRVIYAFASILGSVTEVCGTR